MNVRSITMACIRLKPLGSSERLAMWCLNAIIVFFLTCLSLGNAFALIPPNAAPGEIYTLAGGGVVPAPVSLRHPSDIAVAPDGSLYVSDVMDRRVLKISRGGAVSLVAGGCIVGPLGDGGPATLALLKAPEGIALGPDGSLYIADKLDHRIRRVAPDGIITTVAGTGVAGYSGDGGPAASAQLAFPEGIAVGPDGSVYVADTGNHRIRKITPDGIITTVAGTGTPGYSGDGGPAAKAELSSPTGVSVCPGGIICIADKGNNRVRSIRPDGTIRLVAGNGKPGYSGDGGPAVQASLNYPNRVFLRPDGYIFIADTGNHRIARISPDGTIETFCGDGTPAFSGDGGPAKSARLQWPRGIAPGPRGELYIADSGNQRVRRILPDGFIDTILGAGAQCYDIEGCSAMHMVLKKPVSVAACMCGSIYIVDSEDNKARVIMCCGSATTVIGTGEPAQQPIGQTPVPATEAPLLNPSDITGSPDGNIFVSNTGFHQVVRIAPNGMATAFAGTGQPGFSGDGGYAANAQLSEPTGLALSPDGVLYIADTGNNRIRRVRRDGVIETVAGTGEPGYSGDGGPAVLAKLYRPTDVIITGDGTLFISDTGNHVIRRVDPDGSIHTIAGTGVQGYSGDGASALQAALNTPMALAFAVDGTLFVADSGNHCVRRIDPSGIISTVAGTGTPGTCKDGTLAITANLDRPMGVAVGRDGTLYIADSGNGAVRAVVGAARPFAVAPADLNSDCRVDIADAIIALRFAVGIAQPTLLQIAAADVAPYPGVEGRVRGDGKITIADVVVILRMALGMESM
jgi:sugar lactone lactonase YvrE